MGELLSILDYRLKEENKYGGDEVAQLIRKRILVALHNKVLKQNKDMAINNEQTDRV